MTDPMDELEIRQGVDELARLCHQFYATALGEGFDPAQAFALVGVWLNGVIAANGRGET